MPGIPTPGRSPLLGISLGEFGKILIASAKRCIASNDWPLTSAVESDNHQELGGIGIGFLGILFGVFFGFRWRAWTIAPRVETLAICASRLLRSPR